MVCVYLRWPSVGSWTEYWWWGSHQVWMLQPAGSWCPSDWEASVGWSCQHPMSTTGLKRKKKCTKMTELNILSLKHIQIIRVYIFIHSIIYTSLHLCFCDIKIAAQLPLWLGQRCMFPGRGSGWHWGRPEEAGCWLGPTPRPCPLSVWGPGSNQNAPGNFPPGRWCCVSRTLGWLPNWRW